MRRALVIVLVLALAAVTGGCGDGDADGVRVVATTTQLGDFAREVGGARVAVDTVLEPNADPHDYEPRPSDAKAIFHAKLVLQSGGEVDEWLGDLVEEAGGDAERIDVGEAIGAAGDDDPHWWQDPREAERAVGVIERALIRADPAGRQAYTANARRYRGRLKALDAAIARCFAAIPRDRRRLVTNHDAFGWFARRYGVEVLGSIVPSRSSAAQPSAGEVRGLVAKLRAAGVRTIFPERALNRRLEEAVARDAGAEVGPALYADTLGEPGTDGATYLRALRHDAAAIAEGFGARCALPRGENPR